MYIIIFASPSSNFNKKISAASVVSFVFQRYAQVLLYVLPFGMIDRASSEREHLYFLDNLTFCY